jgi:nicotinamide-nucleotide amidase
MSPATDTDLPDRIGEALRTADATLAIAESCTGGLLASRVTDVAGSSQYFERGFVTYANQAKQAALGVSREALDADGAVSGAVAEQMAAAARDVAGTEWGLATTGIAGPTGGTDAKPVGTAFIGIAWAAPWGSDASGVRVERHVFDGDRLAVKQAIARQAMASLLEELDRS